MQKSQLKLSSQIAKLPTSPGVYKFVGKKDILYIGKATSLKSRVRSYFTPDIIEKRSEWVGKMIREAKKIKFEKTDSVLEALVLEAELIKKYLPPYNTLGKDQKSWNHVVITDEKFPRVLVMRGGELKIENLKLKIRKVFGPFTNSSQLKIALKIIRKIFPFRDYCFPPSPSQGEGKGVRSKPCFNYQIGLCSGVCIDAITKKEYQKTIRHIIQFFRGKKKELIRELEKEMKALAKNQEFEKAGESKKKIFALKHIEDIALIKNSKHEIRNPKCRIEAYDVAHTSGTDIVGVMTVVENGEIKKSDYRLFKIRGKGIDSTSLKLRGASDTYALQEVLARRLKHTEWQLPDLIVVDGGVAQLNSARRTIEQIRNSKSEIRNKFKIEIVAVVKDQRHKAREILGIEKLRRFKVGEPTKMSALKIENLKSQVILANSESHRFAINYHRRLRDKI